MNTQDLFYYIRSILLHELQLDDTRINLYNQRFRIPADEKLFVFIEPLPSKILSSRTQIAISDEGDEVEVQDVNTQERFVIGVHSRNLDAMNRKEEVVMALSSFYSQQVQQQYGFLISRNMAIEDLSELEGAAMLYRYDITAVVLAWRQKVKAAEYYEHFTTNVLGASGTGE